MHRYWTHTINCSSCSKAYKSLNALEIILQIISIASIGIAAVAKECHVNCCKIFFGLLGITMLHGFKMVIQIYIQKFSFP